jgi:hypothetical protein
MHTLRRESNRCMPLEVRQSMGSSRIVIAAPGLLSEHAGQI